MNLGFLIPVPIVAAVVAAGALSPETNVPLAWLLGGVAGSILIGWRISAVHNRGIARIDALEKEMMRITIRFDRLLHEHDCRSSCLRLPKDEKSPE